MNILNILGLGESKNNQTFDWEKELEKKLKEVNEKSIDNPEVRRVYGEIGKIFGTYRSGKVPKAFKIIPNLEKWNEVLQITHPESWTPQAMFQAVNIFASNFDPVRAEEFYKNVIKALNLVSSASYQKGSQQVKKTELPLLLILEKGTLQD